MAQPEAAPGRDAITLLETDHRTVEGIFTQLESARDEDRAQLAAELINELTLHAQIEEQIVYPAVRASVGAEELVEQSFAEHGEVKENLARLGQLDSSSQEFTALWQEIRSAVEEHVAEEETEMFPRFREAMSSEQLDEMGAEIEAMKAST